MIELLIATALAEVAGGFYVIHGLRRVRRQRSRSLVLARLSSLDC